MYCYSIYFLSFPFYSAYFMLHYIWNYNYNVVKVSLCKITSDSELSLSIIDSALSAVHIPSFLT